MRLLAEFTAEAMQVQIMERKADGARLFLEAGLHHTEVDREGIARHGYIHAMAEAFGSAKSALVLGVGGGALATLLVRRGVAVTAVDILREAFVAARRWFFMPETVRCVTADAADFVMQSNERWGAIGVDVYCNGAIPEHLMTPQIAHALAARLTANGVIAWNIALEREGFALAQRVIRLLAGTGLPVRVLAGCPEHVGNAIVYAGPNLPASIRLKGAPKAARGQLIGAQFIDAERALQSETLCGVCQEALPLFDAAAIERSSGRENP